MKPNVLIFCVDEMRADHLGCAGNAIVKTPNLDKLAAAGSFFPNARCNNPICMPARASMFTGLLPRDHGLRVNGQSLRTDLPVLPEIMADNGYRTHSAGKLHLTPWITPNQPDSMREQLPESKTFWDKNLVNGIPTPYYGFQTVDFVGGHTSYAWGDYIEWLKSNGGDPELLRENHALEPLTGAPTCYKMALPEELHYNRYIADSTIEHIAQAGDEPFFSWCSFPDPHSPCAPPQPYCDMYNPAAMPLPVTHNGEIKDLPPYYAQVLNGELKPNGSDNTGITPAHWQEIIAMTYGMITHLDSEIGRVMTALNSSGKADNTIVIFITDHGDMMGDHGLIWKSFYTFNGCTNIPLIISAPGMAKNNINRQLISQIDLMPGILDLCNIPLPGADWAKFKTPFERGSVSPLNNYPGRSFRPMLENADSRIRDSVIIENDDPTTGLQVRALITDQYRLTVYPGTDHGELFDLIKDPHELYNLWYKEEFSDIRSELIFQLLKDYSSDTPYFPVPDWNA
ncbi:MAG: sulfatase-like hydrolase/transferase [Victivallaceae bacterium]|nr:sulfatase-like hydrolase/transferase [Victivallaceae bacterium]